LHGIIFAVKLKKYCEKQTMEEEDLHYRHERTPFGADACALA